ncbi:hypothetical protein HAX54_024147 [Datura stramonium]|uniref:Reverse transcriptase zinc-binding domain-containing protein n=1 Tax=Datura stramonium TaxID=4076 RepID=A0ABS8S5I0_DATST|nr:hypothetical protein [Datura stramonium]
MKGYSLVHTHRNILRQRKKKSDTYSNLWQKGLLFKISFLNWRILKNKVPLDDRICKFGQNVVSKCKLTCANPKFEIINHVFMEEKWLRRRDKVALIGLTNSDHNMSRERCRLGDGFKIIVDMIKGNTKPSWKLQELIEEIQERLKRLELMYNTTIEKQTRG